MKKATAIALIIFTVICIFTACKKDDDSPVIGEDIKVIDFDTTRVTEKPTEIKLNKNYKISLPALFAKSEAGGDLDKYAATFGYDITEEKDGTVTMEMDGMTYSLLLSTIGMKVMIALGEVVDSGEYPYVVKLGDYNEDFSYILMLVNNDKYEKSGKQPAYDELAFVIGQLGIYYQQYTLDKDNKCEVVIAGSKSGKILYREVFTD